MPVLKNLLGKSPSEPTGRLRNYLANEVLGTKQSTIHENVINPGGSVPWHLHCVEEIIVVLEGLGECQTEQGTETFAGGDVIILPERQRHSLRNIGRVPLRQLCFFPGPPGTQWLCEEAEPGQRLETRDGLP